MTGSGFLATQNASRSAVWRCPIRGHGTSPNAWLRQVNEASCSGRSGGRTKECCKHLTTPRMFLSFFYGPLKDESLLALLLTWFPNT